jgi:hypothetical protein
MGQDHRQLGLNGGYIRGHLGASSIYVGMLNSRTREDPRSQSASEHSSSITAR